MIRLGHTATLTRSNLLSYLLSYELKLALTQTFGFRALNHLGNILTQPEIASQEQTQLTSAIWKTLLCILTFYMWVTVQFNLTWTITHKLLQDLWHNYASGTDGLFNIIIYFWRKCL